MANHVDTPGYRFACHHEDGLGSVSEMEVIRTHATSHIYPFCRNWVLSVAKIDAGTAAYRRDGRLYPLQGIWAAYTPAFAVVDWIFGPGTVRFKTYSSTQTILNAPRAILFRLPTCAIPREPVLAIERAIRAGNFSEIERVSKLSKQVFEMKKYLDAHYQDSVRITALARRQNVSREHVARAFVKELGISPSQYLLRLRLEHALASVQQRGMSITDAVYDAGFSDLSNFHKSFQRGYQTVPSSFR